MKGDKWYFISCACPSKLVIVGILKQFKDEAGVAAIDVLGKSINKY